MAVVSREHEIAPARVLILGMGDLGVRIAHLIAERGLASVCLLAGKSDAARQWAQLLNIASATDFRSAQVDGQDGEAVKRLLADFKPEMIVQCATLLSPFGLRAVGSETSAAVLRGGFALQVSAQLPVIRTLMRTRRELGMTCPVINCSYPDVTNAVLAGEGLAPDAGIGNVAIMALRFAQLMGLESDGALQVIGHHTQLAPSLLGVAASEATPAPLVFREGRRVPEEQLLVNTGLVVGPSMNLLAAASALTVLQGLIDRESTLDTHAPGVLGLPGGYPVRFSGGSVSLRLPQGMTVQEAVAFNRLAGRGEGLEDIAEDGTVYYTQAAKDALAQFCPELAEPLHPRGIEQRLALLQRIVRG